MTLTEATKVLEGTATVLIVVTACSADNKPNLEPSDVDSGPTIVEAGDEETGGSGGEAPQQGGGSGGDAGTGGSGGSGGSCEPGTTCDIGKVCDSSRQCVDGCIISGSFYESGTLNPTNPCEACTPLSATAMWTTRPQGSVCGTDMICDSSRQCVHGCFIGGSLYASDDLNPTNMCEVCTPSSNTASWTTRAPGTQCGTGMVCNGSVCSGGCFLDGSYYASGAHNPLLSCETCKPETSSTSWTASCTPMVSSGREHTCAVTTRGGLLCWGRNWRGQLGDGTTTDRSVPTQVSSLTSGVAAVSAGGAHTCAITASGEVLCWGNNTAGELGDIPATSYTSVPTQISGLTSGAAVVSAGNNHTCVLTTGGEVRCWGYNGYGQLGNGSTSSSPTPTSVLDLTFGADVVSAGYNHTCALTAGEAVQCWGLNSDRQLGNGMTTNLPFPVSPNGLKSDAVAVSAGNQHTCALITGGAMWCWGSNSWGQIGDGTYAERSFPTSVFGFASGAAAVSAGSVHTCALTAGGTLVCWGYNSDGRIGDGTTTNRPTPTPVSGLTSGVAAVSAGGAHTCALLAGGAVRCWGYNGFGQLGEGSKTDRLVPTPVIGFP